MKRLFLMLLAIFSISSLSSTVFATNNNTFYVNNAYFKGDGKYDIVVHDPNKETLQLLVNDKKSVKAKVNKKGFATFQKVKLSGQSKLTFAKSKLFKKDVPIKYMKYVEVDSKQVKLSNTGPKHTYDEFYAWFRTEHKDAFIKYNNLPHLYSGSNYQIVMSTCSDIDSNFGSLWVACMQEGYKDYLKPDTFPNDNWMGDYSTMVGDMNYAGPKDGQYEKAMKEAKKLYERLAITN
jgi:hypothetical protein